MTRRALYLQPEFAPNSICWGCGPANQNGLGLLSHVQGDKVVAEWTPQPSHQAFPGILNGGIIGTLLDCHSNWTAAHGLMLARGESHPSVTVTSEYRVRLLRPTPVDRPLRLVAWVKAIEGRRVDVEAELMADGMVTATCAGVFVAVRDDHPSVTGW